jgi:hypothetical protein
MAEIKTVTNAEKIERIENAVISIADRVSQVLMDGLDDIENLEDRVAISHMPRMLLDTLTLWEKMSKIKDDELRRGKVEKPVITSSLSSVSTESLLAIIEAETDQDLLDFMYVPPAIDVAHEAD